jgi:predicted aspartyl protease
MPAFTWRQSDLKDQGPRVPLTISVTEAARAALVADNKPVPAPIPLTALVDTGAGASVITRGIAQKLGLQPVGVTNVHTPSDANVPMPTYAIRLVLGNVIVFETTAIEADLQAQGIEALIGRDVLSSAVFIYTGYAGEFTIAI